MIAASRRRSSLPSGAACSLLLVACLLPAACALAAGNATDEGGAADEAGELAKKLQNPVAALISVPFQSNFEFGGGPHSDGFKYTLNFQPVIPISLSKHWNLISRTIAPVIFTPTRFE